MSYDKITTLDEVYDILKASDMNYLLPYIVISNVNPNSFNAFRIKNSPQYIKIHKIKNGHYPIEVVSKKKGWLHVNIYINSIIISDISIASANVYTKASLTKDKILEYVKTKKLQRIPIQANLW